MKYWQFIISHKTKILGLVTTVVSSIQAAPQVQMLLTPMNYARVMFLVGVLTTLCGWLNTVSKS